MNTKPTHVVCWTRTIPEHWQEIRLDAIVSSTKDVVDPADFRSSQVYHYSIPNIQDHGRAVLEEGESIDSSKLKLVGDELLVSKLNPDKGCIALVEQHEFPSFCSTEFVPLRMKNCDRQFIYYIFASPSVRDHISSRVQSATRSHQRADPADICKLWIGLPPFDEQRAIAAFLDRKTAEIDAVVAKKERLIALLQEERQALISRAVTRGIDPGVVMKDSGIPWLGEAPSHWRIVQLKFLAHIQTGITLGKVYEEPTNIFPYLRVANVQDGSFQLDEITEISVPAGEVSRCLLRSGDVLLTEGGDLDKLGRGSVWKGQIAPCLHQNHIFAVRPIAGRLVPEFLAYLTKSSHGREYFTLTGQKTTNLASTNTTKVGAFLVPLPPLAEQHAICSHIDRVTSRVDGLIAKNSEQIAKLREYRQALISAAVTGKIEVPQEVPT